MSNAPAQCTLDVDPDGTRLAARRAAALERLARTRGTWAAADETVAAIHAQRPAPARTFFREATGPRTKPDETIVWARIGRRDTQLEGELRSVYVHHFNGTHVYFTPEDPEVYAGIRAEHLAAYEH